MITHSFQEYRTSSFHNAGCGTYIYLKFESYNSQSKNLVHKAVDFYVPNALKLTYKHL